MSICRIIFALLFFSSVQAAPEKIIAEEIGTRPGMGLAIMAISISGWKAEQVGTTVTVTYHRIGASRIVEGLRFTDFVLNTGAFKFVPSQLSDTYGQLVIVELPEADYEIISADIRRSPIVKNVLNVPAKPGLQFHVSADRATYIGNFDVLVTSTFKPFRDPKKGGMMWTKIDGDRLQDQAVRDMALFQTQYPNVPTEKILISILNRGSPLPPKPYVPLETNLRIQGGN